MCEVKVQNLSREKERKERKLGAGFLVCTLGFLPRVREVRLVCHECRESTKFQGEIHQPLSNCADNPECLRSRHTSIEGVRSTSAIKRVKSRTSIREEPIRWELRVDDPQRPDTSVTAT